VLPRLGTLTLPASCPTPSVPLRASTRAARQRRAHPHPHAARTQTVSLPCNVSKMISITYELTHTQPEEAGASGTGDYGRVRFAEPPEQRPRTTHSRTQAARCDLPIDGVTGLSPGRNAALHAPHSVR